MPGKRFDLEFTRGSLEGKRARFVSLQPESRVTVQLEGGPEITATWDYLKRIPQRTTKTKERRNRK